MLRGLLGGVAPQAVAAPKLRRSAPAGARPPARKRRKPLQLHHLPPLMQKAVALRACVRQRPTQAPSASAGAPRRWRLGLVSGPQALKRKRGSMIIKLVRHGTSKANTGEMDPQTCGDFRVPLADVGQEQARAAGAAVGADFLRAALIYTSPYLRARQTLRCLF